MPSPSPAAGSARDWLSRARGKLALAQLPLPPHGYLEDLCFFAHQAAELAIKAVYQHLSIPFARVHDLGALIDGLILNGQTIPAEVADADQLNVYAVQTRYPGIAAAVTQAEYDEGIRIASAVLAWAETMVP